MGLNIAKIDRKSGEFTFWDLGGQKVLRKIWDKYFVEADCVVFVIDGTDPVRFGEVKETIESLYNESGDLQYKPLLFLLNKADCPTFVGADKII